MDEINVATFLPIPPHGADQIRAVDPRVRLRALSENLALYLTRPGDPRVDAEAARAEADEVCERDQIWITFFGGELAGRSNALRWVCLASAGADQFLKHQLPERLVITKMPGLASRVIAEWVLMYMLMDCKQMAELMAWQRAAQWHRLPPGTLAGATVGIIGYGAIGTELARVLEPLDARVLGVRRRAVWGGSPPAGAPANVEAVWPLERLHDLLREADYVILAVPLTEQTRGMIGAEEFGLMKDGAALMNIARGSVVDWDAQRVALNSGRLRVYTDVTVPEPLPDGHADWYTPSMIITPHNSGLQPDYFGKAAARFCENLRRYIDALDEGTDPAEALADVVDREAGY